MAQITWSPAAVDELQNIFVYISKDSEYYANNVVDSIIERVSILEKQILIGRVVPEFDNQFIREIIERNYRIVYRIENEDSISILSIHHQARSFKNL